MNGYALIGVGLLIAGAGSFLTFYGAQLNNRAELKARGNTLPRGRLLNGYTLIVAGLLIVAMGTGLTIYGAQINSSDESQEMRAEINETLKKLSAAQAQVAPQSQAATVQEIQDEFATWAKQFLETRGSKRLALDQSNLERKAIELRISANWRPYLVELVQSLRRTVEAYNAVAGTRFEVNLPEPPTNLYDGEYIGRISFGVEATWEVVLFAEKPPSDDKIPWASIRCKKADQFASGSIIITFDSRDSSFTAVSNGDVPANVEVKKRPLAEFRGGITQVVQKLVEAQTLTLSK